MATRRPNITPAIIATVDRVIAALPRVGGEVVADDHTIATQIVEAIGTGDESELVAAADYVKVYAEDVRMVLLDVVSVLRSKRAKVTVGTRVIARGTRREMNAAARRYSAEHPRATVTAWCEGLAGAREAVTDYRTATTFERGVATRNAAFAAA